MFQDLRISRKNCHAGIVTAFTTVAPFRFAFCSKLAASESVGFPSSSRTIRWIMLVDLVRADGRVTSGLEAEAVDGGESTLVHRRCRGVMSTLSNDSFSVSASAFASASPAPSLARSLGPALVLPAPASWPVSSGSGTSVTILIVLFGVRTGLSCPAFSSMPSRETSTLVLKYSSRQSSSLTPFPSGSAGTARFNRRS